jgi:glycerol-3-phosphate acyltransferase PlsY
MKFVLLMIIAYLLGSVPFAFLIAWAHGKDLRTIGSGKPGPITHRLAEEFHRRTRA